MRTDSTLQVAGRRTRTQGATVRLTWPCRSSAIFPAAAAERSVRAGRARRGGLDMRRLRVLQFVFAPLTAAALVCGGAPAAGAVPVTPTNVDVSQRHLNESEEAIAVNPTNPDNIVIVTNVGHGEAGLSAGMFEGVSFDGGKTWTRKLIGLGGNDPLGDACCDPSLAYDRYGN